MLVIARNAPYLQGPNALVRALDLSRERTGSVIVRMPDDSAIIIEHKITHFSKDAGKYHIAEVKTYPMDCVSWND